MRTPGVPFLKSAVLTGALAVAATGCGLLKPLGRLPAGERRAGLEGLPNYYDGQFHNGPNPGNPPVQKNPWAILRAMRNRPAAIRPTRPVPSVQTDLRALDTSGTTVVWFGHSSVLLRTPKAAILIDPIFSNHAGPVRGFVRAFDGADRYTVADLPPIDILVISHDHYDHLDYRTVRALQPRLKTVVVPAGVGAHFAAWGFDPKQIVELAWWESAVWADGFRITATPTQHGSGRTGPAQNKTLWASYVFRTGAETLFYSGDGGYGPHFGAIGARYGPFDLALLECGQYSPAWPDVHMTPEQTAQAAADLRARLLQPVHWAKFAESQHPWNEPVRRLLPAAAKRGIPVTVPRIGEPCPVGGPVRDSVWWEGE